MKTRKLLSTWAAGVLILVGSSFISACGDSFIADGPAVAIESAEGNAGKQLERYFLPPPPGDGMNGVTTASDSTSTRTK